MAMTHNELLTVLHYDPETGWFTWLNSGMGHQAGRAGSVRKVDGRRVITVKRVRCLESRLAWFYMTKSWPKKQVDHIDRNPANGAWANLREATSSEQKCNTKVRCQSKLGVKGVQAHQNGFRARVMFHGQQWVSKVYPTLEEASVAREAVAKKMHGDFFTGG